MSSPSHSPSTKSARIRFDEQNLSHNEEQFKELEDFFGPSRRRLNELEEPKTPYHYSSHSESEPDHQSDTHTQSTAEKTTAEHAKELESAVTQAFDTHVSLQPSMAPQSCSFEQKRKSHYKNIGHLLKSQH
ncbi:hypothetical protein GEMRC1_006376 [Eukaryota sp. GEM-RC1]